MPVGEKLLSITSRATALAKYTQFVNIQIHLDEIELQKPPLKK